ncbi:hypothetical protein HHI36_005121 [Cryptolaemus montrouzieri]|uniref:Uncharacterized protein n=1 Tax=Cryptolaemus montrouzieri TaxID=559131 RepID=A0ABD2NTL6_9CUCU
MCSTNNINNHKSLRKCLRDLLPIAKFTNQIVIDQKKSEDCQILSALNKFTTDFQNNNINRSTCFFIINRSVKCFSNLKGLKSKIAKTLARIVENQSGMANRLVLKTIIPNTVKIFRDPHQ